MLILCFRLVTGIDMATHKKLMTLFSKLGYSDEDRHDLIWEYTRGRTESSKELTSVEVDELCIAFSREDDEKELKRRKRSIILRIAQKVGIHNPQDWQRFNHFMNTKSIYMKPLCEYNLEELDRLIRQFRGIEHNYLKSARKTGNKAWFHQRGLNPFSEN